MGRRDDERIGEQRLQRLRLASPQNSDQRLGAAVGIAAVVERPDRSVSDDLPSFVLVTAGLACFDGQTPVQQHDALARPRRQIAVRGHRDTEIIRQFLVYVGQAARYRLDFRCHAEAQSHRVPGGGVRVLSHDKHFDAVERNGERA